MFTLFGAATNDSISATECVAMVCGDPISQSLHVLGILTTPHNPTALVIAVTKSINLTLQALGTASMCSG